ncbi:Ig-like domain-containing protein [Enterobacteriaceae bacterium LUAb1]
MSNSGDSLHWVKPITQITSDLPLPETLKLVDESNTLLSNIAITCTCEADNPNIVFTESGKQTLSVTTNTMGRVSFSVQSLNHEACDFKISAFVESEPDVCVEPLSAKFMVPAVTVASVSLAPKTCSVSPGHSIPLQATVMGTDQLPKSGVTVNFASSAPDIATVKPSAVSDEGGIAATEITGLKQGTATITATIAGKNDTAHVEVHASIDNYGDACIIIGDQQYGSASTQNDIFSFSLNSGFPSTGFQGATFTLAPTGKPADNGLFHWSVNDSGAITVDSSGQVTLLAPPKQGIITATREGWVDFTFELQLKKWFRPWPQCHFNELVRALSSSIHMPSSQDVTFGTQNISVRNAKPIRHLGTLLGEWGNMSQYGLIWQNVGMNYWVSDPTGYGNSVHLTVSLASGATENYPDTAVAMGLIIEYLQ